MRKSNKKPMDQEQGFSLLEVIIAVAIFVTYAAGAMVAVISAFNLNRSGAEQTIASQYTSEGMEAVRSIRNQTNGFTTLAAKAGAGNQGVASSGTWAFSGTSNTLASDTRFNRTITVSSAYRDSSGNIVSNGGASGTVGLTTQGGTLDAGDANSMEGTRVNSGATVGTIQSMSVYFGTADSSPNNQFQTAIYTDVAGSPGTLVAQSSTGTIVGNGWNTVPITATLSPSTFYWFFTNNNGSNSTVNDIYFNSGTSYFKSGSAFGTWPSTMSGGTADFTQFSMYASFGGTIDPNTYKVTATTSWNFNAARPESVILNSYLTNWAATIANNGDGFMVYGDSTSVAQPKYRYYLNSSDVFSAETTTGTSFTDAAVGKTFKIKTSPTKQEAIVGYVNNSGVLRILCYDGSNWTSEWTTTVGGTATNDQRFGIGYEQTSGDVLVVYSTNTASSNEMAYRTKLGSAGCGTANWSSATNISTARTTGIVQWIRMEPSSVSGSNTIALAWADANSDLSAMEWTGSSFGVAEPSSALETNLEKVTTSQDVQAFDIAMEGLTGNLMIVWSPLVASSCTAGSNCMKYARYTGSWGAATALPTVADEGTNIDLSANPKSNEIVMSAIGNSSSDLSQGYWSGSAWTGKANVDTTAATPLAGTKLVADGWVISGATTRSIVVYMDASGNAISWYVGSGSTFTKQTDFATTPAFGDPKKWIDIQMDPKNTDRLLLSVSDLNSDLFAKKLVMTSTPAFTWTNSDNNSPGSGPLGLNLGQATSQPFSFAYWRNP